MSIKTRLALLLAVLAIPLALAVLFTSGNQRTNDEFAEFNRNANELYLELYDEYIVPSQMAAAETHGQCPDVQPESRLAACETYVGVLANLQPTLNSTIGRLEAVWEQRPSTVPTNYSRFEEVLDLARLTYHSNSLLIQGWNENDNQKWSKGWELRASALERAATSDWFPSSRD